MDMHTQQPKICLDQAPCTQLKGVGLKLEQNLAKKNIHTIQDLLFHLPFRYQDRTRMTPMQDCRAGDYTVIEGVVQSTRMIPGKRSQLICRIHDGTGAVDLRFFHFSAHQGQSLTKGSVVRCFGELRLGKQGLSIVHPEYQFINPDEIIAVDETLTPIYPATEGLSQRSLRQLTDQALALLHSGALLTELLPQSLLDQYQLPDLVTAIHYVHRPPPDAEQTLLSEGMHPMQRRLAFEELLAQQLSMRRIRRGIQRYQAPVMKHAGALQQQLLKALPFTLTDAQKRVVGEIEKDLAKPCPMLRLVQGDVGSGKTIVAALAMLKAVENSYQAVLMAPTEILAEQHYQSLQTWFSSLGLTVAWLSGKTKAKAKREALAAIADGSAQIVVGTHALFQKEVVFAKLGLIIVDEQHRFGVHQRMALRDKGVHGESHPHQLTMTATPIPRSLAMTVYADLDASVIDELPPGRTPVETVAMSNDRRDAVIDRVRQACQDNCQVYWVCTLIEESEVLTCQAAEDQAAYLQGCLEGLSVGLVHGRMHSDVKEQVMNAFKKGELDLLVATTVIEVGVDVPNASLMIIENPERLGLAQLHQLRGRVGRGSRKSYCVLLYQTPLTESGHERLSVMRETNDGFKIAQRDLEIRGPGEILGTKQTGLIQFRIADIIRDKPMLPNIKQSAIIIEQQYYPLIQALIDRWLSNKEVYGSV